MSAANSVRFRTLNHGTQLWNTTGCHGQPKVARASRRTGKLRLPMAPDRCEIAHRESAVDRQRRGPVRRNAGGSWLGLLACGAVLLAVGCPLPAARAGDGDAVVLVDGRPISKQKMVDVLMESHGLAIMQQLVVLELAKEESRRLNLRVSAGDVDQEFARALSRIAPQVGADGQALSEEEKRQALEYLLQEKCLSLAEFQIGMERNAHLRKIVERDFRADEATLREEFARVYGEKVEVRHIQIGDVNGLHEALNLLDKGTDFAAVATRVSQDSDTAKLGGLLKPFAFNDEAIAPVLREAAFSLKPGERTQPIKVGRWWFILRLERRVEPSDVRFEDVRDKVAHDLRERVIPEKMNKLVADLFQKAEIRVLDAELKRKFEDMIKKNALTDSATRP